MMLYLKLIENAPTAGPNLSLKTFAATFQECAPGYSLIPDPAFPGRTMCVGCNCNGHSSTCDPHTGACLVSLLYHRSVANIFSCK